jgi:hypothetical protein
LCSKIILKNIKKGYTSIKTYDHSIENLSNLPLKVLPLIEIKKEISCDVIEMNIMKNN